MTNDAIDLCSARWKLRTAIRVMNQTFDELGLEQHPDTTCMVARPEASTSWAIILRRAA